MHRRFQAARVAALVAGIATTTVLAAAPAHADPVDDAFLNALDNAGVAMTETNPADAVAMGQSVCPMLSEPGQTAADAAAKVADGAGMSLGPATMFTGLAISMFCPGAVAAIGNGENPIPFGLLGF